MSTSEQHSIVKSACKNLLSAHLGFNNFYTEPPFAQRLLEITSNLKTPETVQREYVYTVLMGFVGNPYGVSNAAIPYYEEMIKNFSPKEIDHLINILGTRSLFSEKIKLYATCRNRYLEALNLIDRESMKATQLAVYESLIIKIKSKKI